MMRNWFKIFSPALIVLAASVVWAVATTSIVQKSSGSAFTLDMALDSVTGANRQMTYLTDPSTASLVSPATSTKQAAPGVSGTASNDVYTVQGQVGMTPVLVDPSANSIQGSAAGVAPPAGNNVVSVQGIASMTPVLVTPSALPDNQSVNIAQINAVTPLMGNGVTGTGSPRVTIASNNTAFSVNANAGTNLNTSALALDTSITSTATPVTPATATATKGNLGGCQYNATPPTFTDGQQGAVGCDVNGSINVAAQGRAASGATATSPIPVAFDARTSNLSVTNGQQVYGVSTLAGAQIVYNWSIPELSWQHAAVAGGIVNSTTAETLSTAAGTGVRNYCTQLQIFTIVGTYTATEIAIRDGPSGTVLWRGAIPSSTAALPLPALNIRFDPPLRGNNNTLMEFVTLTATGASTAVYVNAQGFRGP